ncbi:alpha-galactosidase 2 isoform X1 [Physcomitrium patens]|uniref:Alpha-galactosidase n=1 Tax=Physcomitrium patens TaxID=3218 RepID=A0A2K1JV67_PHYPA|nr:uncharacterized protein LOC112288973 isoform X1 [Physcomitrium patens]PNR45410.1 hypothetical protein PHYPA_015181 [Physcomitrium patens]|eukprot:XP_024389552.1 uncharacterized protein LOC112288973 isoform X1 [Physcomitrella patens]
MSRFKSAAVSFVTFFFLILCKAEGAAAHVKLAETPPRGWNSYNSFSWIVSEAEFLDNAKFVSQNLLKFGYEYVVVDFLWYRKFELGASVWSAGHDVIDEWGRPIPDPGRWPSSRDGSGLARVAEQVHAMGLKFGIHVMRGISSAAVEANTPILGAKGSPHNTSRRPWLAADIAVPGTACRWMSCCFMGVDATSEGGRAFVKSLYDQYASWSVDFIKHDCVFGVEDFRLSEIELVANSIAETGRPIVYSLSPGVQAFPDMGREVSSLVNMYRVTGDDWDLWSDLKTHFDVARDFAAAGLIGATNARGRSWADLDMLPLGWLTDPGAPVGPHRWCNLTPAEQRTQVSLWAIAKSPLMYGGDLRAMDSATLSLITNTRMLEINAHSVGNHELLSRSPSHFGLSECKNTSPRRWSLRPGPHSKHGYEVCWTSEAPSKKMWRRGGDPLLECFKWTPFTNGSQEVTTSSNLGFISSPRDRSGCLAADVLGIPNSDVQQARMSESAGCSRGEPNQLWRLTLDGELRNDYTGFCASVADTAGERIWVARHPSDKVFYVVFFNLDAKEAQMSVGIDTVVRRFVPSLKSRTVFSRFHEIFPDAWSYLAQMWRNPPRRGVVAENTYLVCKAVDLWDGRDLDVVEKSIGAIVEAHGAAAFALTCAGL